MRNRMDILIRSVHHIERYLEDYTRSLGRLGPVCPDCTCGRTEKDPKRVESSIPQGTWLDRQGVMDYLQISYRTYYRLKAKGTLQPHRFGGRDYYFIAQLDKARDESIRRGRI